MLTDDFPRLQLIDLLLRQKRYEELQLVTETQAAHGLITLQSLDAARSLRAPATVLYVATLCAENLDDNEEAQRWLAVYQSIGERRPNERFVALCAGTPLGLVATAILSSRPLETESLKHIGKHPMKAWHEAAECAMDFERFDALLALAKHLTQNKFDILVWLNFARVLFSRQDSIRRCVEMGSLGHAYLLVRNQISAHVPAVAGVRSKLALYACRAFALAGRHEQVLETAKLANLKDDAYFSQFEVARALCRMQRLPESIAKLDQLVISMSQYHRNNGLPQPGSLNSALAPPEFDVEQASFALVDLQQVLSSVDQQAFLVSGTLLGYAREGQLLAHDKDIDVGIVGWEGQFDVVQSLLQSGHFEVNLDRVGGEKSYHIPLVHIATRVHIDIFIYHPEGDKWVTGVESDFGYLQKFAFTPFGLKCVKFLGIDFFVPDDVETKLAENFGNWRESDPCYISHLESPSTVDVGGDVYQVVARLRALEAMAAGNGNKLSRVIQLMERLSDHPHSMKGWALPSLKAYLDAQQSPEVAHAA
jgi:hypothetical protein